MQETRVFVKELNREVEVIPFDGYYNEYGDWCCIDAEEVVELYHRGDVQFNVHDSEFVFNFGDINVVSVATIKEIN